jgi:hypothetical protein
VSVPALKQAVLRQEPGFVVTRKGAVSGDHAGIFRRHLAWGGLLVGALAVSVPLGHVHVAIHSWAVLSVLMCLMPVALWLGATAQGRRRTAAAPRYAFSSNTVVQPQPQPQPQRQPAAPVVVRRRAQPAPVPQESLT